MNQLCHTACSMTHGLFLIAASSIAPLFAMQQQPKVIYFDFGGVVAIPDRQIQMEYLIEKLNFPPVAIQDSPYLQWMQLHKEEVEYLSQIALAYQIKLTPEDLEGYRIAKRNSIHEIPGILELIEILRQKNYEVNLITNVRSENLDLIQPYVPFFDRIIHCPKDPGERREVWETELYRCVCPASQLLLIDDQTPNVIEAENLGLQAIPFDCVEHLIQALKNRGISL